MEIFHKIIKMTHRKKLRELNSRGASIDDREYLTAVFKYRLGYKLDLNNPITFNEKMQWLKLFDRNPLYTMMVDKHAVKSFVSGAIGERFVAKELGVYNRAEEIDLSNLPNSFVAKTTHGCGGMFVVKNKSQITINQLANVLNPGLNDNYYYHCREWPYKDVPPKIIIEEYLKDNDFDILPVYKFFCFNGEPYILQAIQNDKHSDETIDYFDMNWTRLKLKQNFPNSKHPLKAPKSFSKMKEFCKILSKGIPFVRCDFYDVNGEPYFSEFTFYSDAGFERFYPNKWDRILGDRIDINKARKVEG